MLLIWLVGAAFLYWPFRQWVATSNASLISALLWPLMLIVIIVGLFIAYFKREKQHVNSSGGKQIVLEDTISSIKIRFMFAQENVPTYFIEEEVWRNSDLCMNIINSTKIESDQKEKIIQQYIVIEWFKFKYGEQFYELISELTNLQVINNSTKYLSHEFSLPFNVFYKNNNDRLALATQIYKISKEDFISSGNSLSEFRNILELNGHSEELMTFHRLKDIESQDFMLKRQSMSYEDYDSMDNNDIHVKEIDMHEVNYLFSFITDSLSSVPKLKVGMSIVQGLI